MDFAMLLRPYACEAFMNSIWGRSFIHVHGTRDKFSGLLPWRALNTILAEHRLTKPRILLVKEGVEVSDSEFIFHFKDRRGKPIAQILASELNEKLRSGHTLIVNQVDELYEPITELAELLEYEFHERVQINAYVAWGRSGGFKLHRDDHDVFVLQIAGRKYWRVCGSSNDGETPPPHMVWEGMMEEGDLLYLPKGWWHEARAEGGGTLHLTCGIQNRTGLDLLMWMQQRLQCDEFYRADLPRFASRDNQLKHIEKLRDEINALFDPEILSRFFRDQDARAISRPHLSLPWGVMAEQLPEDDDILVKFTVGRPTQIAVTGNGDTCELLANGKRWVFPRHFEPILRALISHRLCRLAEIYKYVSLSVTVDTARKALSDLVFHGLVTILSRRPVGSGTQLSEQSAEIAGHS